MDNIEEIVQQEAEVEEVENVIKIDDGRIDVKIQNQFGEPIGVFRFNPMDVNIVNRYNESSDKFAEIIRPLENYNISSTGEGDDEEAVKVLNEAEDSLIDLMDYILDGDSKKAFFSKTHAFTPTDGTFYCGKVFDVVGTFIAAKFGAETKKIDVKLKKYTHGYRTGKHARGKQ